MPITPFRVHRPGLSGIDIWGNWAVAKLVEALFDTSHLSDVGCTYKLLHRSLALRLLPRLRVGGSHFGPELMLAVITSGARFVEVPVNYLPREGTSAATGDRRQAVVLGLQTIGFILQYRLKTLGRTRRPGSRTSAQGHRPIPTP